MCVRWEGRGSLHDIISLALRMCLSGFHFPSLASFEVILIAARLLHVFGADVKALHHDAVSECLGDLDADGCAGDVEYAARAALVELVWHALHHGRVDVDVNEIADLEDLKVGGQMLVTLLAECLLEEIARVCALSVRANHCGE